jgi:hypothetical protein
VAVSHPPRQRNTRVLVIVGLKVRVRGTPVSRVALGAGTCPCGEVAGHPDRRRRRPPPRSGPTAAFNGFAAGALLVMLVDAMAPELGGRPTVPRGWRPRSASRPVSCSTPSLTRKTEGPERRPSRAQSSNPLDRQSFPRQASPGSSQSSPTPIAASDATLPAPARPPPAMPVITDEASPFALRSTRNHPRRAVHQCVVLRWANRSGPPGLRIAVLTPVAWAGSTTVSIIPRRQSVASQVGPWSIRRSELAMETLAARRPSGCRRRSGGRG